jgi:hypothetical protein
MTMLNLKTLGLQPTYLPGFPLAPEPKTPSLRTKPVLSFIRPGRQAGELLTGPEGAVVGGVVAALVQLDHFLRRALDMGFFKTPNKFDKNSMQYKLRQLVAQSDQLLEIYGSQYDNAVADTANRMSGVLGQSAELMLNLSPRQVQSSLTHQHNMAAKNMDYVPAPVASKGLLPTTNGWRLVAVESPYAGDVETNLRYLRACMKDCLSRRETPLAAHGLLTQPGVVDEGDEAGQQLAAEAGVVWTQYAQATVIYTDLGTTRPMKEAAARAKHEGRDVEYRTLEGWAAEGQAEVMEVSQVMEGSAEEVE